MFDCGNSTFIPISQLCDGSDDCQNGGRVGEDETAVICDSKSSWKMGFRLEIQKGVKLVFE